MEDADEREEDGVVEETDDIVLVVYLRSYIFVDRLGCIGMTRHASCLATTFTSPKQITAFTINLQ